jgi:hypothetical protein
MMEAIMSYPDLKDAGLLLQTNDAQGLYERFGFQPVSHPERWLNRPRSDLPPALR